VARKENEEQLCFQVVSIVDGKRVNLDGLAEQIRAARMKNGAGEPAASQPANVSGHDDNQRRCTNPLEERIRRAKERAARLDSPDVL
jgi:hypothetical protein